MTEQRRRILETVRATDDHPTADEVYRRVRRELQRISLGTVYRNLDLMAENGLLRKMESGTKMRFDADRSEHPHVRCVRCGRVDDAPVGIPESLRRDGDRLCGYSVIGCEVQFLGICPECRAGEDDLHD